jgi:hypothetical protein
MTGRFLVRSKGSLQLVDSLDGYPNATVLGRNVPDPPSETARWEDGQWIDDEEKKSKAERKARLQAMTREELVDMIEARLEAVERRIAALEEAANA